MSVFLRRVLRAATSTRRSFATNETPPPPPPPSSEKRKIEYVAVNVSRHFFSSFFFDSTTTTRDVKAFGEPRTPDSLEAYADLFRTVTKEEAEQLGIKRSKGWRLYIACILMVRCK
jgi:hypothetical protein